MAKGRFLTPHQKGIVKRYYQNQETLSTQKLGELVSELYLTTDDKKASRLWKQAHTALLRAGANKAWLEKVVAERNVKGLANIVSDLF